MSEMQLFYAILFVIFLFSVVLHELAHGGVAYFLGDDTAHREGRLTLNPFAHLDLFGSLILPIITYQTMGLFFGGAKPIPVQIANLKIKNKNLGDFLITIAGPLTNLILAILLAFSLRLVSYDSFTAMILAFSLELQVFLFCFNLLPIPPLDGSHIAKLFLPQKGKNFLEKNIFPLGLPLLLAVVVLVYFMGWQEKIPVYLDKATFFLLHFSGTEEIFVEIRGYIQLKQSWGF